jgi:hypothetical protein
MNPIMWLGLIEHIFEFENNIYYLLQSTDVIALELFNGYSNIKLQNYTKLNVGELFVIGQSPMTEVIGLRLKSSWLQ